MGRIVAGGRTVALVTRKDRPGDWASQKFQFDVYGPTNISEVEDDLDRVRRHFRVSKANAFKIALRLTAKAIEEGGLSLG
jgi:hypothetical protein